jgi:hypothetical protein
MSTKTISIMILTTSKPYSERNNRERTDEEYCVYLIVWYNVKGGSTSHDNQEKMYKINATNDKFSFKRNSAIITNDLLEWKTTTKKQKQIGACDLYNYIYVRDFSVESSVEVISRSDRYIQFWENRNALHVVMVCID